MDENTCLRCGTPYEPDATVCLTCGAPIGETKSPTQPVRALKVKQPPAEEPAPPSEPPPPVPTSVPVVGTFMKTAPPAPVAPASRRRRSPLVAVLVCVVVLAVLGGAAYMVRAFTAPPPVAHQAVYHDPQHRFSFQHPVLWSVSATADGARLTDSAGTSSLTITVTATTGATDPAHYADLRATRLGLVADDPKTIGGEQWVQRIGQVTGNDGAVREVVMFVTVHAGQVYTIESTSPLASYDSINTLVYQPLLDSFSFA